MPLLEIRRLTGHTRLGLWAMSETPDELKVRFPHLRSLDNPFSNIGRQKEFLCIRALLAEMTGDTSLVIDHEPSGRPTLKGWEISISHTKGYCALVLSCGLRQGWMTWEPAIEGVEPVAVDIEQRADRVRRIAPRFIRPDEEALTVEQMLVIWSAKETLYKLHSEDDLQFFEMRVREMGTDTLLIENMKRDSIVAMHYELTDDYVLTCHPVGDLQANR